MKLREFADVQGMTNEALADWLAGELGVSRDGARKWVYGTRTPRLDVLARIEAATAGQVTANDFLPASPAIPPSARNEPDKKTAAAPKRAAIEVEHS